MQHSHTNRSAKRFTVCPATTSTSTLKSNSQPERMSGRRTMATVAILLGILAVASAQCKQRSKRWGSPVLMLSGRQAGRHACLTACIG
jgi:hypothetical protein